jgi:toxin ParE1/3/4
VTRNIIYSPEAMAQLLQLQRYIAQAASADIARNYVRNIMARCDGLAEFSERDTPRDDVRPGLRTIAFRRRVIIAYMIDRTAVTILGIFYGGQDFEDMLGE